MKNKERDEERKEGEKKEYNEKEVRTSAEFEERKAEREGGVLKQRE